MLIKLLLLTENEYTQFIKDKVLPNKDHKLLDEFEMMTPYIEELIDHIKNKGIEVSNQLYDYVVDYGVMSETHILLKPSNDYKEKHTPSNDSSPLELHAAIIKRIQELADERNKTVTETAKLGGIRQSTISEIMNGRSKHPKVSTILQYCQGCNISLSEFFDTHYFKASLSN